PRLQDRAAQALNSLRHEHGALDFESAEVRHEFDGERLRDVQAERPNRAKSLIENLMVTANGVAARFLDAHGFPSLRRVVRSPERWDRIRALASQTGDTLRDNPDPLALNAFLAKRRAADPDRFTDLSTAVIKLI